MSFLDVFFRDFDKEADAFHTLATRIGKPVDIYTTENALVLEIAVVGLDKEDIHIKTEKDMVRITASGKEISEDNRNYQYRGISTGSFDLGYRIASNYDVSKLEASLEKGLLKIVIPTKTEEEQGIKEVTIQ